MHIYSPLLDGKAELSLVPTPNSELPSPGDPEVSMPSVEPQEICILLKRTTTWYYVFVNINKTLCNDKSTVVRSPATQSRTTAAAAWNG